MPTEAGRTAARQAAWAAMTGRNWTQGDLAAQAGADPATVSDFLAGKRWPRPGTLGKLEEALGLTLGTLAALGEEQQGAPGAPVAEITDADLAAEFTYRIRKLRQEVSDLDTQLGESLRREQRRDERRRRYLARIDEDSDEQDRHLADEWTRLMFEASGDGGGWSYEDERRYEYLCDYIDTLAFIADNPGVLTGTDLGSPEVQAPGLDRKRTPRPAPRGARQPTGITSLSPKHQQMVKDSMPVEEAAYTGHVRRGSDEWIRIKEAREAEKRAGEESQDDGGFDPA